MSEAYVAEIIEASTTQFRAECRTVHEPPPLGSFVKVYPPGGAGSPEIDPFSPSLAQDGVVFGLVIEAVTGSLDPNRRPAAFGLDEDSLRLEQPQITELLSTTFTARLVGHIASGRAAAYLPDKPPMLHSRVFPCAEAEVRAVTDRLDYVRSVLDAPDRYAVDEVIAASLRAACTARAGDREYLIRAGKELALMLRDDYDRLQGILRRLAA